MTKFDKIIDAVYYRYFQEHKFEIFEAIEEAMDKALDEYNKEQEREKLLAYFEEEYEKMKDGGYFL